jgi:hypothetical protein
MEPAGLLKGLSRETTIRRDARGRWFHDGSPLEHPGLIRAFDSWIDRAEDGRYCLRNEINWAYITLEGPPFFVRSLTVEASGDVDLFVSDGRRYRLDPSTLRQGSDGALYCDVRDDVMTAQFDRHAMMQLADFLREDGGGVYLQLGDRAVRPPVVADPLQQAAAATEATSARLAARIQKPAAR